jgi:recombination DNA repair RAD52 pathway protein
MTETPKRPIHPYSAAEAAEIQTRLNEKLDASDISHRPAPQGTVAYLEGWKAFNLANEVFGFNGWSSEILSLTPDFVWPMETQRCVLLMFLRLVDGSRFKRQV